MMHPQRIRSDCDVKMNRSTRKKMRPPIRFATISAMSCPMDARKIPTPARMGVLACHLSRESP
jgi:hypothetical protein